MKKETSKQFIFQDIDNKGSKEGDRKRQFKIEKISIQADSVKTIFDEISNKIKQYTSFFTSQKAGIFKPVEEISKILSLKDSTTQCWHLDLRITDSNIFLT